MKNIIIKIIGDAYSHTNDTAYQNLISYISQKSFFGGYGILPPYQLDFLTEQFIQSEYHSHHYTDKKVWHFIIAIQDIPKYTLASLANTISSIFCFHYQCIYGIDFEHGHDHIHFAVNAYSYQADYPTLSQDIFESYLEKVNTLLSARYPEHRIDTIWGGEQ